MKTTRLMAMMLGLTLAACAQAPKPGATSVAVPPSGATAPPAVLAVAALTAMDPAMIATAQRNLRALGYAGKSGDMTDAAFERAILAFEKDHGLAEDGHLTPALAEKLRLASAALSKPVVAADVNRNAMFLYSDGSVRKQALELIPAPPPGLVADAPANLLQPLRPGMQAGYHLGSRAQDGSIKPVMTVTCQVGRVAQTSLPLGLFDTIAVDCRGDAPKPLSWHALYSPALGLVLRQQTATGTHDLVAIRPVTGDWPSAARTGLDWALTHALEAPESGVPVDWSSTAVAPHFEIKASTRLSGAEAGLSGKFAAQSCRRFEMVQSGTPAARFPGIACQSAGVWSLPGTAVRLAAPATGLGGALRSAQK